MTTEELGRRERKRLQTEEAISRAALELFTERGFEATTIADITERADVSRRTFFSYFPAKEDVVFSDFPAFLASFEEHLAARAADQTVFDALRSWLPVVIAGKDDSDPAHACRRQIIESTPQLEDRRRALQGQFVELLAAEAARDLGVPRDDLRAQLVGSAATTALTIVEARTDHPHDTGAALAQMEQAITFLRGGLQALRDQG